MGKTKSKFPQFLWVKREQDGSDSYFLCFEKPIEATDGEEFVVTGFYEFKEEQMLAQRVVSKKRD